MAPVPTGTACCMARPRMRKSRAVSASVKAPAAASAEYSPSEWPATNCASRARSTPASASSTRMAASDTAISAGCAFSVSVSLSAGPSHMVAVSFSPSAASTSSNTARAGAKASASALPMPTAWLPWPGNTKAADIARPFAKSRRKVPILGDVSSRTDGPTDRRRPAHRQSFECTLPGAQRTSRRHFPTRRSHIQGPLSFDRRFGEV